MRAEQLKIAERVMVVRENGDIQRGTVRSEAYTQSERYYFVDFPDQHRVPEFSSTGSSSALQQFSSAIIYESEENQMWCRGWLDVEEVKAIFAAEALK